LSFAAIFCPKRKLKEGDFSWVEPLKRTIWNLFDIRRQAGKKLPFSPSFGEQFFLFIRFFFLRSVIDQAES